MILKILHDIELFNLGLAADFHRLLARFTNVFNFPLSLHLINGTPVPVQQTAESSSDFQSRLQRYWEQFLQNFGFQENITYASRDQATLREELSNEPLLRNCSSQRGADNTDINLNSRISPASVTSNLRQRTYDAVPIASVLYFACSAIASSEDARPLINEFAGKGMKIPRFLHEMLQVNRRSTLGPIIISPSFISLPNAVLTQLNLLNTIFDFNYLVTRAGIASLFSLLARISNYDSNYIEFVEYSTAFPMESGFTTTMMSFTVIPIITALFVPVTFTASATGSTTTVATYNAPMNPNTSMYLHPSNTYEKGIPNGAHLFDAYLQQRQIIDSSGKLIDLSASCTEIVPSGQSLSLTMFALKRMTSFKNSPKSGKPPKEPALTGSPVFDSSKRPSPRPTKGKEDALPTKFIDLSDIITKIVDSKIPRKFIASILKEVICLGDGFTNRNIKGKTLQYVL